VTLLESNPGLVIRYLHQAATPIFQFYKNPILLAMDLDSCSKKFQKSDFFRTFSDWRP
jgi:hypothetical protein